jgi:hypothetical protein
VTRAAGDEAPAIEELRAEFERQVATLLRKGYPQVARLREGVFLERVEPLKQRLSEIRLDEREGRVPFVIVISGTLVPPAEAMPLVELGAKRGFTRMEAGDLKRFTPLEGLDVPRRLAYLLVDVDSGRETLNVTPDEAINTIAACKRSPLTIDEGVALVTQRPEILQTHNCFSMLGSRCGDRRVTAIWISESRPRLGWCWAGHPHTWLGSATCRSRIGAAITLA